MSRRLGVTAVAACLVVLSIVAMQPAVLAATRLSPISCAGLTGAVHFVTPLSPAGVATSDRVSHFADISLSGGTCNGHALSVPGGMSLFAKTQPGPRGSAKKYVTGTWGQLFTSQLHFKKMIPSRTVTFQVAGERAVFRIKASGPQLQNLVDPRSPDPCGSVVGMVVLGKVGTGTYPTKAATFNLCFVGDAGGQASGDVFTDMLGFASGVTSFTIGGGSNATL